MDEGSFVGRWFTNEVANGNAVQLLIHCFSGLDPYVAYPALVRPVAFIGCAHAFNQIGLAFEKADNLADGNLVRFFVEVVPSLGTAYAGDQAGFLQCADQLFKVFNGDLLNARNFAHLGRGSTITSGQL